MTEKIKALAGISGDADDAALAVIADEAEALVKAYTGTEELTPGLEALAARIGADMYLSQTRARSGAVSVTEGERRIEFGTPGCEMSGYREELERFRDKRGYLPSDIG